MIDNGNVRPFESVQRLRLNKRHGVVTGSLDPQAVRAKVIEDINFLRDRIEHVKRVKGSSTNQIILGTYQSMLDSREAALSWIEDNFGEIDPLPQQLHGA